MRVSFDYNEGILSIDQLLKKLPAELQSEEKKALRKTGAIIKKNVIKHLHSSGIEARLKSEPRNYDGSTPYVHIKDDVSYTVRKNKQGDHYVSVKGGKFTGYKWGPLNDGHIARDGKTFVPGTKFMERALQASEGEVESVIHEMLRKVVD